LIRTAYNTLEVMPIGMASYQSEYDQYMTSYEQQQQQQKEQTLELTTTIT
jgi:hypothetical protein